MMKRTDELLELVNKENEAILHATKMIYLCQKTIQYKLCTEINY